MLSLVTKVHRHTYPIYDGPDEVVIGVWDHDSGEVRYLEAPHYNLLDFIDKYHPSYDALWGWVLPRSFVV